jgi:hypothetical protein
VLKALNRKPDVRAFTNYTGDIVAQVPETAEDVHVLGHEMAHTIAFGQVTVDYDATNNHLDINPTRSGVTHFGPDGSVTAFDLLGEALTETINVSSKGQWRSNPHLAPYAPPTAPNYILYHEGVFQLDAAIKTVDTLSEGTASSWRNLMKAQLEGGMNNLQQFANITPETPDPQGVHQLFHGIKNFN